MTYKSIAEIVTANKEAGQYFFSPDTMAFWGSKVETDVIEGCYFVTSEDNYDRSEKVFKVRKALPDGRVNTVEYKGLYEVTRTLDMAIAHAYAVSAEERIAERKAFLQETIQELEGQLCDFALATAQYLPPLTPEIRESLSSDYLEMLKTLTTLSEAVESH
jgi:hypothetical protein